MKMLMAIAAQCASLLPCMAMAQVAWTQPYYGEVLQSDTGQVSSAAPLSPYDADDHLPFRVTGLSTAGVEGVILGGAAAMDDGSNFAQPMTAYAMKIATSDGRVLWRWQPDPAAPTKGRVRSIAIDHAGHVIVVGTTGDSSSNAAALVAKLDGASGTLLWRIVTVIGSAGYDVRVDAADNVIITSSDPAKGPGASGPAGSLPGATPQRIAKLDGATGELIWALALPDGSTDWDDFRLALDPSGNAVVAGHYEIAGAGNTYVHGTRVARIRATDGTLLWEKRSVDPAPWGRAIALAVLGNGDPVVLASYQPMTRYAAADGAVVWGHDVAGDLATLLVAPDDAIYAAGPNGSLGRVQAGGTTLNLARIDPATGLPRWTASLANSDALATELALARNGNVLVAWQRMASAANLGIARVDEAAGAIEDAVDFGGTGGELGHVTGIVESTDGGILVGSALHGPLADGQTFNVTRLSSGFADRLFGNGFE